MAVDHATDIRRTITGLVLAAIVVLALVLRGWVLLALILLVAALGLWEFFSLFWGNKRIPSRVCAIALGQQRDDAGGEKEMSLSAARHCAQLPQTTRPGTSRRHM